MARSVRRVLLSANLFKNAVELCFRVVQLTLKIFDLIALMMMPENVGRLPVVSRMAGVSSRIALGSPNTAMRTAK